MMRNNTSKKKQNSIAGFCKRVLVPSFAGVVYAVSQMTVTVFAAGGDTSAVTMALVIIVCNAFINAGLPAFTGDYADWAKTLIYLCEMTFSITLTIGSVKGAQSHTSKVLGL